jgi:hypothetical protein
MGMVTNILADKNDNCYAFNVQSQTSNIVNKYNPAGNLIWSKVVSGQVILNGYLSGDSLFVCGSESIDVAEGRNQNPTFSILSVADGKILQQQVLDFYGGDEGYGEGFDHVVFDGAALYLAGHAGSQSPNNFLVKLSKQGNINGIQEQEASNSYSVFPNPSGSNFTLSSTKSISNVHIIMRNALGQVVFSKSITKETGKNVEVSPGELPAGTYFIEVVSGTKKTVKKMVME